MATPLVLMPALAGMAASYVLQVGVDQWSGLGESQLAVPGPAPISSNVRGCCPVRKVTSCRTAETAA